MFVSPLIPVIDVRGGIAVRGVGGQRQHYRSVRESGLPSDRPRDVGLWYRDQFGLNRCYVADLDALAGAPPDLMTLEQLLECGFEVLSDAAWARSDTAGPPRDLMDVRTPFRPIASLESIDRPERLTEMRDAWGSRSIFSLDLRQGSPLTAPGVSDGASAETWIERAVLARFETILLLDLADVGTGGGTSTRSLLRQGRERFPSIHWWGGGGIRSDEDVAVLVEAGFEGLLVASALLSHALSVRPDRA